MRTLVAGQCSDGPVQSAKRQNPAPPVKCANGDDDRARFTRAVLPYLDDAVGLARWLVGHRADAEDVVQEACLRALRGIGGFNDRNPRAWTMTIVRNTAYDWLRRNRSTALASADALEALERAGAERGISSGVDTETPEAALIAKADAALVRSAIAALPPEYRETIVLRELQGFAYREIASVTGVPIGTVMSRLARARRRLTELLMSPSMAVDEVDGSPFT